MSPILPNVKTMSMASLLLFSLFLSTDRMDAVFIDKKFAHSYRRTFSTSYQTYHNVKIMYSGNDYRSWIDVIVSYNEIFENKSLLENKYHYQYISESHRTISMIPYTKDQILVFNIDKALNEIFLSLKSRREHRINNEIVN